MPANQNALPTDPLAAATHDDPRSYYAELAEQGLVFDTTLRCWVSADADVVAATLSHPHMRVRPSAEPVPPNLQGSTAARLFAALVRMTDGPGHAPLKRAIESALDSVSTAEIHQSAIDVIPQLALPARPAGAEITRFHYALPTAVLAHWIGIPQEHWPALIDEVLAFVRCVAPGGSDEEISAGIQAASQLERRVRAQLQAPGPLLLRLDTEIARTGLPDRQALLVANVVGLWFQACEGCAGLMGLALQATQPDALPRGAAGRLDAVLDGLPPIQNTRRFAAGDVEIAGCPLHAGDMVLTVLSTRSEGMTKNHAFGHGPHACPGARWARTLAIAGIEHVQQSGVTAEVLARYAWRRSANARVPEFY